MPVGLSVGSAYNERVGDCTEAVLAASKRCRMRVSPKGLFVREVYHFAWHGQLILNGMIDQCRRAACQFRGIFTFVL